VNPLVAALVLAGVALALRALLAADEATPKKTRRRRKGGRGMAKKRVFVSFDFDNDKTLKDFIIGQSDSWADFSAFGV